jgi:hypothetical protein
MLDAVGGCFRRVHLGARTTSAGEDRAFITLTNVVKEKSEAIRIAEATARAVAQRVDKEGPSVTNQAIRVEKIGADTVMPKPEAVSIHTNMGAGTVDVNEESQVPAKVKATRARIEVDNVDTTEVSAKVKATRARIEEGNVDTTEATFTTSIPIVRRNVGGKNAALAKKKVVVSKPATTSGEAKVQSDVTNLPFVATPVKLEKKGVEVTVVRAATVATTKAVTAKAATAKVAIVATAKAVTAKAATPEETPAAPEEDSSAKDERLQVSAVLKKV